MTSEYLSVSLTPSKDEPNLRFKYYSGSFSLDFLDLACSR